MSIHFIRRLEIIFAFIIVYVDDLNLVRTLEKFTRITNYFKKEFEIKDLGKTNFVLVYRFNIFQNEVLVYQLTYIKNFLKCFDMDKTHLLSFPMVVQLLEVKKTILPLQKW